MSLAAIDRIPHSGDGVVLSRHMGQVQRYNTNRRDDLPAGMTFTITRVFRTTVLVRSTQRFPRGPYDPSLTRRSYTLSWADLDYDDSVVVAPGGAGVRRRRLGQKPEDTGEMVHIGIDHPGIQWLFEDMGAYATQQNYCSQYDALAARLGIPGRPREFNVRSVHNGLTFNTMVRARSQAEANQMVHDALNGKREEGPAVDEEVSGTTPPEPVGPIAA